MTWTGKRRRRGCDVDHPWRGVAETPHPRRGYSIETGARLRYVAIGRSDKFDHGPPPALCRVIAGRAGASQTLFESDAAATVDDALTEAETYLATNNVVKLKKPKAKKARTA